MPTIVEFSLHDNMQVICHDMSLKKASYVYAVYYVY